MKRCATWMVVALLLAPWASWASLKSLPPFTVSACLGVNIHFIEPQGNELEQIHAAGFGMVRMDFVWERVERVKGTYDFSGYQRLTESLGRLGMTPIYILDYSHSGYEPHHSVTTEEGRRAFARFAAAAVKAMGDAPIIWEIWNEPNLKQFWEDQPSVRDYVLLVEAAVTAMRAVDPDCTVVAPATSGIPMSFLEGCFDLGLLQWIDAVSVHPYREKPPESALPDYESLRALIQRYATQKTIPILSGEWGFSLHRYRNLEVTEHRQAQFVARQFLTNLLAGVRVSIWYDWHDDGTDPNEREHNFGIVKHDYQKKEAYVAAQVLMEQLQGMKFVKRLDAGVPEDYLVLFAKGNQRVLAAWTTGEPHTFALKGMPVRVDAVSMLGAKVLLKKSDQGMMLPLSEDPLYVTLREK